MKKPEFHGDPTFQGGEQQGQPAVMGMDEGRFVKKKIDREKRQRKPGLQDVPVSARDEPMTDVFRKIEAFPGARRIPAENENPEFRGEMEGQIAKDLFRPTPTFQSGIAKEYCRELIGLTSHGSSRVRPFFD
jgi:hypothetical protein